MGAFFVSHHSSVKMLVCFGICLAGQSRLIESCIALEKETSVKVKWVFHIRGLIKSQELGPLSQQSMPVSANSIYFWKRKEGVSLA